MFQEVGSGDQLLGKTQRILLECTTLLYFIAKNSAIPLVQQYIYFLVDNKYNFSTIKANILDTYHLRNISVLLAEHGNITAIVPKQALDNVRELADIVNHESSLIVLFLNLAELLPSAVIVVLLGFYSDVSGRRKMLMWLPCLGNGVYALGLILPLYLCNGDIDHPATKSIFVLTAILSGLSGNIAGFMSGNASYISDTDSPRRRTLRLAIVEFTIGMTFAFANFGNGFWIKATRHFEQPLWFIFACSMLAFVIALFILKEPNGESVTANLGRPVSLRNFKGIKHLFRLDSIQQKKLWAISVAFFVYVFVQQGQERTYVLFLQSPPLYWRSVQIGAFFLVTYGLSGLASWPGVPLLLRVIDDVSIFLLALISKGAASFVLAFATENFAVYLSSFMQLFHLLPFAVARSLASQQVADDEQGAVYGLIHSMQAIVGFLGPLVLNAMFAVSLDWMPGFVFMVSGPLLAIPLLLIMYMKYLDRKDLGYDSMDEGSVIKPTTPETLTPMSEAATFTSTGVQGQSYQGAQEINEYSHDGR